MTPQQLFDQLNYTDETHRIEAKRGSEVGNAVFKSICAFSNGPGVGTGYVLFGAVKEPGLFQKYSTDGNVTDPDKLQRDLANGLKDKFSEPLTLHMQSARVDGNTVVMLEVPELPAARKPLFLKKEGLPRGVYIRSGTSDQSCTLEDVKVLLRDQDRQPWETRIVQGANWQHIDHSAIREYKQLREAEDPNAPELQYTDEDLLRSLHCLSGSGVEVSITNCGLLFFGTADAHSRWLPTYRIDYTRMPGEAWITGFSDSSPLQKFPPFTGPLVRQIQASRRAIIDSLPDSYFVPSGSMQRKSISRFRNHIVRELLVNAIMHRDYTELAPTQIVRYSNRLEIMNMGASRKPVEQLHQRGSVLRNANIAHMLFCIGLGEQKGHGIPIVREHLRNLDLLPPVFQSDVDGNSFNVSVLLKNRRSSDYSVPIERLENMGLLRNEAEAVYLATELKSIDKVSLTTFQETPLQESSDLLRRMLGRGVLEVERRGVTTHYRPSQQTFEVIAGVLDSTGNDIDSTGNDIDSTGNDSDSTGDVPQDVPKELLELVTQLGKRADLTQMKQVILRLCEWRSLSSAEMASILRKNQQWIRERYISQLLDEGLMAIQGNSRSPGLRYVITVDGLQWIKSHDA